MPTKTLTLTSVEWPYSSFTITDNLGNTLASNIPAYLLLSGIPVTYDNSVTSLYVQSNNSCNTLVTVPTNVDFVYNLSLTSDTWEANGVTNQSSFENWITENHNNALNNGFTISNFYFVGNTIKATIDGLIQVGFRNITGIQALPNCILYLSCGYNILNSLPPLPINLISLQAQSCNLQLLPLLPNTLVQLDVQYNILDTMPAIPPSLTTCIINNNKLSMLNLDTIGTQFVVNAPKQQWNSANQNPIAQPSLSVQTLINNNVSQKTF